MKINKDGLERNIIKLWEEWKALRDDMGPHLKRWIRRPWDSHAYVNLFVEARRSSAYLVGHIDAVLYPLFLGFLVYTLLSAE